MRLLILGGDGFCGWPTSLHLSALGHDVAIVDNLSRRKIDNELECESLTPIRPMGERLRDLLKEWRPNAHRHDRSKIPCVSLWRATWPSDAAGVTPSALPRQPKTSDTAFSSPQSLQSGQCCSISRGV